MLPFIGRSEEIGLIRNLSREIVQGDGLGLLWIEGEAGIGKSHLLKQSLPLLEEDQLLPLHAQLYPDSSSSVWSLVADVLSNDRTIQHLLLEPTKPTPVSVTKALRRLSRLRPVVLVIEDVHLLDERGKYELTELLRAIQGNPICLIMASRTEGGAIYGLALSYLVQTIQLKPLTVSEIHQLLIECQAPESSLEMAEEFHRATRGIPFVVRSVLAGMSSEFRRNSPIAYNGNGKSFRKLIEARSRMSMEQIIFDLTAKLTSEQLDAAKRLALLGQVFSEGSAIMLLGKETNDILHVLQQEGVISKLVEPSTPLFSKPDISSEEVWKFSHTILVHLFQRSAYEQGEDLLDTELLITLLSSSTSFYSITPLVYLSQRDYKEGEKVKAIATLMIGMTWSLAKTPHISIMPKLYYATRTFYERNRHSLATDVQEELGLALLNLQLLTTLHQRFSPKHREAQQQLLDKTADPQSHLVATYRIYALSSMSLVNRTIPEYLQFKLDEADAIVKKFPDLLRDSAFIKLLVLVACTFYKSRLDGLYNRVRRYYDIIQ
ncbi:MAG: AAA family ATPase [Candidatus Kapaibacterium sp.]